MLVTGGCLCRDISFECETDNETDMLHCHCSMCRKHHGSAFVTLMSVRESQFRWVSGEERLARYQASEASVFQRTFCPRCGSSGPLFTQGWVSMPAGWLDADPGVRPTGHIFTGPQHKASWFEITDRLEQHDNHSGDWSLPVVEPSPVPTVPPGVTVGSCLCGTVVFHVTEAFRIAHNCHCSRCRKGRAAAHATNGFVPLDALTFVSGEDNLSTHVVPKAKGFKQVFCRTCGSLMPERYPDDDIVCLSFGALDTDPGRGADDNIYVAYKAPWFEITDGRPCCQEGPPN